MADRRQVLRAIVLGAAGLAVPAACGLPSGDHPVIDGPGPATGPGSSDNNVKAPAPEDANDPKDLVVNFFGAVTGRVHSDADLGTASERVQAFLTAAGQQSWPTAGSQITVVRMVGEPTATTGQIPGSTYVDVTVQASGILRQDGSVGAATGDPRTLRFTVVPIDSSTRRGAWLIDRIEAPAGTPPGGMMLSTSWLDGRSYQPQLVYYWSTDNDRRGLVPDLRYVPRAGVSLEIQRTEIVDWVLAGPSDWLRDAVQGSLYNGASIVGPNLVAPDQDGLLINLTVPPSQGLTYDDVMAQMRWSLRPIYLDDVRLQINGQRQRADASSFRAKNLADSAYRGNFTEFCVAGGVVRQVDDPTNLPQVLSDPATNKDVQFAALSRDLRSAALVRGGQLFLGSTRGADKPVFRPVSGLSRVSTRPVFLPANTALVLAVADGGLWLAQPDGSAGQVNVGKPVTAFAVAPDGHRISLITADGGAWVSGLRVSAEGISLGALRQIVTGLTELTGIAWSQLDRVLVAGRLGGGYALVEATIDGAIATTWSPFASRITSVAAWPPLPWQGGTIAALVQTANGTTYRAFISHNDPLTFTSVPTPAASGAPALGAPANPFYID
jgi:hypothetical protein